VLYDYVTEDLTLENGKLGKKFLISYDELFELQKELKKHRIFHPDDDFADYYKVAYGTDIPIDVDYTKYSPDMEEIADFIREYYPNIEDIETWLKEESNLHEDWIAEFLKRYPEFKK